MKRRKLLSLLLALALLTGVAVPCAFADGGELPSEDNIATTGDTSDPQAETDVLQTGETTQPDTVENPVPQPGETGETQTGEAQPGETDVSQPGEIGETQTNEANTSQPGETGASQSDNTGTNASQSGDGDGQGNESTLPQPETAENTTGEDTSGQELRVELINEYLEAWSIGDGSASDLYAQLTPQERAAVDAFLNAPDEDLNLLAEGESDPPEMPFIQWGPQESEDHPDWLESGVRTDDWYEDQTNAVIHVTVRYRPQIIVNPYHIELSDSLYENDRSGIYYEPGLVISKNAKAAIQVTATPVAVPRGDVTLVDSPIGDQPKSNKEIFLGFQLQKVASESDTGTGWWESGMDFPANQDNSAVILQGTEVVDGDGVTLVKNANQKSVSVTLDAPSSNETKYAAFRIVGESSYPVEWGQWDENDGVRVNIIFSFLAPEVQAGIKFVILNYEDIDWPANGYDDFYGLPNPFPEFKLSMNGEWLYNQEEGVTHPSLQFHPYSDALPVWGYYTIDNVKYPVGEPMTLFVHSGNEKKKGEFFIYSIKIEGDAGSDKEVHNFWSVENENAFEVTHEIHALEHLESSEINTANIVVTIILVEIVSYMPA